MKRFRAVSIISILLAIMLFTCSCSTVSNMIGQNQGNPIPYGHYIPYNQSVSNEDETFFITDYVTDSDWSKLDRSRRIIFEINQSNLTNPQIFKYGTGDEYYDLNIWNNKLYFSQFTDSMVNLRATDLDTGESTVVLQDDEVANFTIYDSIIYGYSTSYDLGLYVKTWDLNGNFKSSYNLKDYDPYSDMWIPYKDHMIWVTNYYTFSDENKEIFAVPLNEDSSIVTKLGGIEDYDDDTKMRLGFVYYNNELLLYNVKYTEIPRDVPEDDPSSSSYTYENTLTFYSFDDLQENSLKETDLFKDISIEGDSVWVMSNNNTLALVLFDDNHYKTYTTDKTDSCLIYEYNPVQNELIKLYEFEYESFTQPSDFRWCITTDSVLIWKYHSTIGYHISLDPNGETVEFTLDYTDPNAVDDEPNYLYY